MVLGVDTPSPLEGHLALTGVEGPQEAASSPQGPHARSGGRGKPTKPLTISFVHHSLDDHRKHAPVQVKVQLRRKGGKNGQDHGQGAGEVQ